MRRHTSVAIATSALVIAVGAGPLVAPAHACEPPPGGTCVETPPSTGATPSQTTEMPAGTTTFTTSTPPAGATITWGETQTTMSPTAPTQGGITADMIMAALPKVMELLAKGDLGSLLPSVMSYLTQV